MRAYPTILASSGRKPSRYNPKRAGNVYGGRIRKDSGLGGWRLFPQSHGPSSLQDRPMHQKLEREGVSVAWGGRKRANLLPTMTVLSLSSSCTAIIDGMVPESVWWCRDMLVIDDDEREIASD